MFRNNWTYVRLGSAVLATALLFGCASTPTQPGSTARPTAHLGSQDAPINRPVPVRSSRIRAEISPRGAIPYDNQSLPLVSPDGRFIATQTRIAPSWATVLAQHDATVPFATRIEIYRLDADSPSPTFHRSVDVPVVTGRSVTSRGFLVEAPQENGSRWIGLALWETGEIEWLVTGDDVNAFASLGPDGRLAWSRRAVDWPDDHFELVVRRGEHDEWSHGSMSESWLLPTWSGRGDGLFAMTITDGHLDAVYAQAADEVALRQSMHGINLASYASVTSAFQSLCSNVNNPEQSTGREELLFHHPAQARAAIWRPRSGVASMTLFDVNSFAAVPDGSDYALVTMPDRLLRQSIRETRDRRDMLAGVHVPRATNSPNWQYILLAPNENSVSIMTLNPVQ